MSAPGASAHEAGVHDRPTVTGLPGSHPARGNGPSRPSAAGQDITALAAGDLGSARILVQVEPEPVREAVGAVLRSHGYDVIELPGASGVVATMRAQAIDAVVLGWGTRDYYRGRVALDAIRSQRRYADVPVLLLGGAPWPGPGTAIPSGADDVVPDPVDPVVLLDRVRAALRTRRSLLATEAAQQVVASLANELLPAGSGLRLHTERLGAYAAELGRRVGLSASDLHAVAFGTLLHDLAKLVAAEVALTKPGPLTDDEVTAMRRHTEIGERIATPLVGHDRLGPILRHHHERWDGQGYPDGLAGVAIPMGARIIAVVDAFDSMTQYRPYRSAMAVPAAVAELRRERGRQFDPALIDTFVGVLQWDGLI